jgi:glycosyltransferase involved in cell wall biosynthesis
LEASALLGQLTGVGTYVRELLPPLARELEATLFFASLKGGVPGWVEGLGAARVVRSRLPARGLLWAWHYGRAPRIESIAGDCELVHSLNYTVVPTRRPLVVTLHDLWFLKQPGAGERFGGRLFARDLLRHGGHVAHWIAVSEATKRDAMELLGLPPERISVVLEAPREDFLRPMEPEEAARIRRRLELPEAEYLLFYGSDDPRKNRAGLEAAYARLLDILRHAPPLVVVGGRQPDPLPHVPIVWRPYLPAGDLHATLLGALGLVFPSFYEGFGLPVVEALALGVPVAASATGAIPEVAGPFFVELDPTDVEQMAGALARLSVSRELRKRLREEGPKRAASLSWERAARETAEVYRRVLGR